MNNARQYLQINLGNIGRVTGIATQGRRDAHQWVTRYMLSYGDGTKFVAYRERNKVRVGYFLDHFEALFQLLSPQFSYFIKDLVK